MSYLSAIRRRSAEAPVPKYYISAPMLPARASTKLYTGFPAAIWGEEVFQKAEPELPVIKIRGLGQEMILPSLAYLCQAQFAALCHYAPYLEDEADDSRDDAFTLASNVATVRAGLAASLDLSAVRGIPAMRDVFYYSREEKSIALCEAPGKLSQVVFVRAMEAAPWPAQDHLAALHALFEVAPAFLAVAALSSAGPQNRATVPVLISAITTRLGMGGGLTRIQTEYLDLDNEHMLLALVDAAASSVPNRMMEMLAGSSAFMYSINARLATSPPAKATFLDRAKHMHKEMLEASSGTPSANATPRSAGAGVSYVSRPARRPVAVAAMPRSVATTRANSPSLEDGDDTETEDNNEPHVHIPVHIHEDTAEKIRTAMALHARFESLPDAPDGMDEYVPLG